MNKPQQHKNWFHTRDSLALFCLTALLHIASLASIIFILAWSWTAPTTQALVLTDQEPSNVLQDFLHHDTAVVHSSYHAHSEGIIDTQQRTDLLNLAAQLDNANLPNAFVLHLEHSQASAFQDRLQRTHQLVASILPVALESNHVQLAPFHLVVAGLCCLVALYFFYTLVRRNLKRKTQAMVVTILYGGTMRVLRMALLRDILISLAPLAAITLCAGLVVVHYGSHSLLLPYVRPNILFYSTCLYLTGMVNYCVYLTYYISQDIISEVSYP